MKRLTVGEIKEFAQELHFNISNATEIVEIFYDEKEDQNYRLKCSDLDTVESYIQEWKWNWFRYSTWEELIQSEIDQGPWDGLTEDECESLIGEAIFKLSSGMYIQSVF